MKVALNIWNKQKSWQNKDALPDAQLVIYFGGKGTLDSGEHYRELKSLYPKAHLLGCSTGGEIYNREVLDGSIVAAAIQFERTALRTAVVNITGNDESFSAGQKLAQALQQPDLTNIFILSDGTNVNGSDLVRGLYDVLDEKIIVTGGLAGDAADFGTTFVGLDHAPQPKSIAAVGFYGKGLQVGYGSVGGWDSFGPKRKITKSKNNVLYELDGKPALDLYKQYLGPDAERLPGSALLFPLSIRPEQESRHEMVRTVVGIDEAEKSLTFAGDVPEGFTVQLMRGDFNHLVEGAATAAGLANLTTPNPHSLAILVSCIGRKLLLGQQISDETESVADVFQNAIPTIGFYSYGEICHQQFTGKCGLHNQTMTVTLLHEPE